MVQLQHPRALWEAWLQPRDLGSLIPTRTWGGSIGLIIVSVVALFFVFGFWWPYWRIGDMDLGWTYEAFLYNDGLQQEIFDHPGYLTFVLLGAWLNFLHSIGLVAVDALSQLPPPAEAATAWTDAIRAGRVMSLGITVAFLGAFSVLLLKLIKDWRVAVLGTLALAYSGGLEMHARIIRNELLSGGLVTIALLLLLLAAQRPKIIWRPALLGIAAFCCVLAMINKVQVIALICALPAIALPFGVAADTKGGFWRTPRLALPATALILACMVLICIPVAPLVRLGLSALDTSVVPWQPLLPGWVGVYQSIIVGWIVLMMICFAALWRVSALETVASMGAMVAGAALAMTSLYIWYNPQNVLAVMNPLEQLHYWAAASDPQLAQGGSILSWALIGTLLRGVATVVATRTFILDPSARPTIFLEWLVIAAMIFAWRRGQRLLVAQAAVLMCTAWAVDATSTVRGLQIAYFIYTDPLVIIAACLLLAGLAEIQTHRWAYQIGGILIAAHIVVSLAEPVKHTFQSSIPTAFCVDHEDHTLRVLNYSFCHSS